jgi:Sec-independent protein secretion pathway component TatC
MGEGDVIKQGLTVLVLALIVVFIALPIGLIKLFDYVGKKMRAKRLESMQDGKSHDSKYADTYWIMIFLAPLSVFAGNVHGLPVYMWLSFALGFIAALNRFRYELVKVARIFAGIASGFYGISLALMLGMGLKWWP